MQGRERFRFAQRWHCTFGAGGRSKNVDNTKFYKLLEVDKQLGISQRPVKGSQPMGLHKRDAREVLAAVRDSGFPMSEARADNQK